MGSHTLHKKQRHSNHQEETIHQHAAKRPKRGRSMTKGNYTPRNHKVQEFVDGQDRLLMEQSTDDYVHTWLEQVTKEHQGQMHQPASGLHNGPFIHVPPVDGHRRHSSEQFSQAVVKDLRKHKKRKYESSDSSMLLPAYERSGLSHQDRSTLDVQDVSKELAKHHSNEHSKKRKKRGIFSSISDESESESDQSQSKEMFEKRSRHKTRADRYESKPAIKKVDKDNNSVKKKTIKVKRGDAAKLSRKAGEDLIKGFRSKNVAQDRLTMRPGAGIYKNGRASSPSRLRGLPDLAFSEMQFLKPLNRPPADSEKEVIISKSSLKSKRERERARNEISSYFLPERQPLQETTINYERMGNSELPSDAGKSESTSIVMGRYSRPAKPTRDQQKTQGEQYLDFGDGMPGIRKSTLPKQNPAQIFIPRAPAESHLNNLSKTTSYYTWSETVRSPSVRGGTRATDAPLNQERSVSRVSGKRMPVQPRIYKEIGIQASLNPETDLSTKSAVVKQDSKEGDIQQATDQPLEQAGNLSTTGIIDSQIGIKDHDEDKIYQLQANRAILHDYTPHSHSKEISENNLVKSQGPCQAVAPIQEDNHTKHATAMQCSQVDTDKINQRKDDSKFASQLHQDSEVQNVLSRAVLAQRAYINRRSTPNVTVDLAASASDAQAPVVDAPNARGTTSDIPDESYKLPGSNISTEPQGPYRNVQDCASQPTQVPILLDGLNEEIGMLVRDNLLQAEPGLISTSIGQVQSNYNHDVGHVDVNIYQANDLSYGVNHVAFGPGRVENKDNLPQAMLPGRGFGTSMASMSKPQHRNVSQLSTMKPIYARQLHSKMPITEEELHEIYNAEEQELGNIYLYEGGQWEKESRASLPGAPQSSFVEAGDVYMGQDNQCDMYDKNHDEFRLTDDAMYYVDEAPLPTAEYHGQDVTSRPEGMLFFEQESGPSKEYQWMPTQQRYFSSAADNVANLGSWESAQTGLVPQEHLLKFWRPRKGY